MCLVHHQPGQRGRRECRCSREEEENGGKRVQSKLHLFNDVSIWGNMMRSKFHHYRLFANIVSNKKDYPNNMVFTKNKLNMIKLNAARKKTEGD
jgi:hypothetical protein